MEMVVSVCVCACVWQAWGGMAFSDLQQQEGIWPAPVITIVVIKIAIGGTKLYLVDSWHDQLWKIRNWGEGVYEAEKGKQGKINLL